MRKKKAIREKYIAVYSNPKVRSKQLKQVEEMFPLLLELLGIKTV